MRNPALPIVLLAIILSLSSADFAPTPAFARPSTPTPLSANASPDVLHVVSLAPLEDGVRVVTFDRAEIMPQERHNIGGFSGSAAVFLVSGEWSVEGSGAIEMLRAGSNEAAKVSLNSAVAGSRDDLMMLNAGASVEVTNVGTQAAELITVVVTASLDAQSTPTSSTPRFGDAVELPAGPLDITISQFRMDSGVTSEAHQATGPELINVESGTAVIALNPGRFRILRSSGGQEYVNAQIFDPAAQPTLDPNDSEQQEEIEAREDRTDTPLIGAKIGLSAGDAGILESGGKQILRSAANATVVLLIEIAPGATGLSTPIS